MRRALLFAAVFVAFTLGAAYAAGFSLLGLLSPSGWKLQWALIRARPGDEIVLTAGTRYAGPFRLPNKAGDGWITIRSSAEASLPPEGTRVDPSHAPLMPKLESSLGWVISNAPGAHHYRFVGIEIRPTEGVALRDLVKLGTRERDAARLPHHIVFERCYIHGDARAGSRRGIALNAAASEVLDSYLSDFKEVGADSQAIAGWNGPGPFRIENNHLEGAGENLMFGGADPSIPELVPSDIAVLRNHLVKPLAWKTDAAEYEGTHWSVKNLLELKNARRVRIEGNVFERSWADAQTGFAVLFTVRNQDGRAPWSVVEDVTFANNVVRHAAGGLAVLGFDDNHPSQQTRRIAIRNNLFEDIGGAPWGGDGRLFQILDGAKDVAIEHNTAFQTGNLLTTDGRPSTGFVFRDNIAFYNEYGVHGAERLPGADFRGNVVVGGASRALPAGNFFPDSIDDVGLADRAGGDYRLRERSPYAGAGSDGRDVGADVGALAAALRSAVAHAPARTAAAERHAP